MPLIHVAVPHADDEIKVKTAMDLFALVSTTPYVMPGVKVHLTTLQGCYIENSRTKFAQNALAAGADYLLFVDTDMHFEPDALVRLLTHVNRASIVGVNYHTRSQENSVSTVKMPGTEGPLGETSGGMGVPTEPFECYGLGTGLLLIDMKVFKALPYPWFAQEYHPETGEIIIGDDVYFCRKAGKAGFKLLCDPTIPVGHLGLAEY